MGLQKYNLADLERAVMLALAGTVDANTSAAEIVNTALNWLVCENDWSWRRRPLIITAVSYTPTLVVRASNVVTVTKSAHGLNIGDAVRISGTLAPSQSMDGTYLVSSVPTTATFTFNQGGPDETATTVGTFIPGFLPLPDDFGGLESFSFSGFTGTAEPVSMAEIVSMRSYPTQYGLLRYFYCVSASPQSDVTKAATYRIEIYPTPIATTSATFAGSYWRIPANLTASTDVPNIPSDMMDLLRQLCRAFAISNAEERMGPDWELAGQMLATAKMTDANRQSNLGRMRTSLTVRAGNSPFVRKPIINPNP